MASGFYISGITAMLRGDIDFINTSIAVMLVDSTKYTVDLDVHTDLSDIPPLANLGEVELTSKQVTLNVFTADSAVFPNVEGTNADAVVLFANADQEEDCTLISYIDNCPEFPLIPDGTNITINWDPVGGIFDVV